MAVRGIALAQQVGGGRSMRKSWYVVVVAGLAGCGSEPTGIPDPQGPGAASASRVCVTTGGVSVHSLWSDGDALTLDTCTPPSGALAKEGGPTGSASSASSAAAAGGNDPASSPAGTSAPAAGDGATDDNGNNGVGNGLDPQPPGDPPVNDGSGSSPGDPGNKRP
jgi:hypothetical protein